MSARLPLTVLALDPAVLGGPIAHGQPAVGDQPTRVADNVAFFQAQRDGGDIKRSVLARSVRPAQLGGFAATYARRESRRSAAKVAAVSKNR